MIVMVQIITDSTCDLGQARARELGLHTILKKYQPLG